MVGASNPVQNQPKNLLAWIRGYSEPLFQLARKSPIPTGFQFSIEPIKALLESNFHAHLDTFSIQTPTWKDKAHLFNGPESSLYIQNLTLGALDGFFIVALPKQLLTTLFCSSLEIEKELFDLQETKFQEDALTIMGAHLVSLIAEIPELKQLDIARLDGLINEEAYLVYDIETTVQNSSYTITVALSRGFALSWKQSEAISNDISTLAATEIPLIFEAGQIHTSLQELASMRPGDFIQIDLPYFSKSAEKLRAIVTLEGKPIFHVRIKEGAVKIVETPLQYQEQIQMTNPTDKLSDEDLVALEVENITIEAEEEVPQAEDTSIGDERPLEPKDIPIILTVELTRMKMTGDQLLELKPGSVLDVEIQPEKGVVLSISGKIVGKGELLQVGNVLGIRLTKLVHTA